MSGGCYFICKCCSSSIFSRLGELTAFPQILQLDFRGHFAAEKERGKGRKGGKKKGRNGTKGMGEKTTPTSLPNYISV